MGERMSRVIESSGHCLSDYQAVGELLSPSSGGCKHISLTAPGTYNLSRQRTARRGKRATTNFQSAIFNLQSTICNLPSLPYFSRLHAPEEEVKLVHRDIDLFGKHLEAAFDQKVSFS